MAMEEQKLSRPLANFPPTVWGFSFSSFTVSSDEIESYTKSLEELKEQVKGMLAATANDLVNNTELINLLCRLGISYHYENEIEEQLCYIFNTLAPPYLDDIGHHNDLYTVALLFRILRQHGYKLSSDVFKKFKDSDGKFKKSITEDVRGILSLYEACFLSMHGEDILEEALAFVRPLLESLALESSHHLAQHIKNALIVPFHKGMPRVEAIKFISFYEEEESRNETLLKFAKLDFNRVQLVHRQELAALSRWWKDLNLVKEISYSRDRIAESYLMAVGVAFEPEFALCRIFVAKFTQLAAFLDDTYDSYGTLEELKYLTDAFERFNIDAINQLPADNFKAIYRAFLFFTLELENVANKNGSSLDISHTREKVKDQVRSYHREAQWYYDRYSPSFEEYLQNGLISCTFSLFTAIAFTGMEKLAGVKEFEWQQSNPQIVHASKLPGRLSDDIVGSREDEQKEGHCLAWVSYMKEYGVSKEKAMEEIKKMLEDAWKDMNEAIMRPNAIALRLLMISLNLSRVMEVVYTQYEEGFTNASNVKELIHQLFLEQLPV